MYRGEAAAISLQFVESVAKSEASYAGWRYLLASVALVGLLIRGFLVGCFVGGAACGAWCLQAIAVK